MDGAWALYEAWVRLQHGDIDTALVFGSGKSSPSKPDEMWAQQLDPYYLAPLGVDPASLAGIQARALLDAGKATERDFAEVVARNRRNAKDNPERAGGGRLLASTRCSKAPYVRAPLRAHDFPPISDGAVAVVLARGDRARALCDRPAWIRGLDHRIEVHQPGMRDLTTSTSTTLAARKAGYDGGPLDVDRAVVDVQPAGADPARGARARRRREREPVGRRARGQPGDGDRTRADRRGRAAHRRGLGEPRARARDRRPGPAAQPGVPDGG